MTIKFDITNIAGSTPFDNTTNGFVSDNVQDAIEEARNEGLNALIPFTFVSQGNTADKWLGYTESAAPSNEIPFICPQDSVLCGITFSIVTGKQK